MNRLARSRCLLATSCCRRISFLLVEPYSLTGEKLSADNLDLLIHVSNVSSMLNLPALVAGGFQLTPQDLHSFNWHGDSQLTLLTSHIDPTCGLQTIDHVLVSSWILSRGLYNLPFSQPIGRNTLLSPSRLHLLHVCFVAGSP